MVIDIMKFTFLYLLVLFAFSCGMNQLLWYYADLEKKKCIEDQQENSDINENSFSSNSTAGQFDMIDHDINHCLAYRRFAK